MHTETFLPDKNVTAPDSRAKLGQILRDARCEQGLTQVDVANFAGIDRSYLCKLELGKNTYPPSDRVLSALASKLSLDAETLTFQAGRLTPQDLALVSELYQRWGQAFLTLLKEMHARPTFAKHVFEKMDRAGTSSALQAKQL